MSHRTTSTITTVLALACGLISASARADEWALTLEAGGGPTLAAMPTPYTEGNSATTGVSGSAWVTGRYALRNNLEIAASAFLDPTVSYFHNGVAVPTSTGPLPGTLEHHLTRYGALVGPRYVTGMIWRFVAGVDFGWSHRSYTGFNLINDSDPKNLKSYPLGLLDQNVENFVVAPLAGVEWNVSDHFVIAIIPHVQILVGAQSTVAVTIPVTVGWSWFL